MASMRRKQPGSSMVVDLSSTSFSRDQPSDTEDKQSNSSDSDNDYQEKMDEVADAGLEADLNLQDVEVDISEDELESPVQRVSTLRRTKVDNKVRMKPKRDFVSAETIMLQPELKLMQLEKERELNRQKYSDPYQQRAAEEMSLMKRFPWLAEKLKHAWEDDKNPKGQGKMRTALNMGQAKDAQKRTRFQAGTKSNGSNSSNDEKAGQTKVVFSRNIPLLIYNTAQQKCIRVGGDRTTEAKSNLEEVYRAIHFNPELKKITLDLDDIRFPEKDRTVRLALSYISANTLHNPFVLSDDFYKYSWKKELMIKQIVQQIEKRIHHQLLHRQKRKTQLKDIDKAIKQQKEEEELRDRDFITANRLLEESKEIDQEILTQYEKNQERKRRIRLRTKSMPTAERVEVKVRQRTHDQPHITLKPD